MVNFYNDIDEKHVSYKDDSEDKKRITKRIEKYLKTKSKPIPKNEYVVPKQYQNKKINLFLK